MNVEVVPPVSDEIALADLNWDGSQLQFKMAANDLNLSPDRDPWHFSVYDKDGVKLAGGAVYFPVSIKTGQTVKASLFVGHDNMDKAARIEIHR